jgi:hypothetical protein
MVFGIVFGRHRFSCFLCRRYGFGGSAHYTVLTRTTGPTFLGRGFGRGWAGSGQRFQG